MTLVAPPAPPSSPASGGVAEQTYRTLTPEQLDRIAPRGRRRHVEQGEVLVQARESAAHIFVVVSGRIDVVRPGPVEAVVVSFGPGMFTGEVTLLSGRPGLAHIRVGAAGQGTEFRGAASQGIIQTPVWLDALFW